MCTFYHMSSSSTMCFPFISSASLICFSSKSISMRVIILEMKYIKGSSLTWPLIFGDYLAFLLFASSNLNFSARLWWKCVWKYLWFQRMGCDCNPSHLPWSSFEQSSSDKAYSRTLSTEYMMCTFLIALNPNKQYKVSVGRGFDVK